jgi:excisionase family DNA binding protein
MPESIRVEEAARRLEVTPETVRHWLGEGKLRGVKLGKTWRIQEAELERVLREGLPQRREVPQ